ncbi:MAG TPA: porin, partial [Burkholderiaceae bacterium]|nr:porin [Burkholderiaceae bacterium]
TSRIGFRGSEDLGGGLRALFQLESGINADTGTSANSTKFWDRQAWVGLQGAWGTMSLGRQTSLLADAISPIDPLGLRLASFNPNINIAALSQHGLANQYGPAGSTTGSYRLDNAIKYGVRFADITARAMYAAGEQTNSALLDAYGAGLAYQKDDLALAGAYMHFRNNSGFALEAWVAGGAFRVGPLRLKVTYGDNEAETTVVNRTSNRTIGAGVGVPVGPVELTLAHYDVDRERTGFADDGFGRTVAFAEYLLSKRSKVYAEADTTRWQNNYQGAANRPRAHAFSVGVMHSF